MFAVWANALCLGMGMASLVTFLQSKQVAVVQP